jgi:phage baseplate assembly protein gpV
MARVVGLGGGSSRGFFWVPEIGDEVLVAFNQNDERDAYILGGMWSMTTRPPVPDFAQQILKRVIQTGKKDSPATGHTVEFDDALQSITIKTSTAPGVQPQKIVMDPKKIEITANQGTMKISMDLGPPPAITIQATAGNIELQAPTGQITMNAAQINMTATAAVNVQSTGPCALQGMPLRLNS